MSQHNSLERQIELYKNALERERLSRERAEDLLESRTSMLYLVNQKMSSQYEQMAKRNKEISYLNSVVWILNESNCNEEIIKKYLDLTCALTGWGPAGGFLFVDEDLNFLNSNLVVSSKNNMSGISGFENLSKELHEIAPKKEEVNKIFKKPRKIEIGKNSYFIMPMEVSKSIDGLLIFECSKDLDESSAIIDIVANGSYQLTNYIERKKSEEKLKNNFAKLKDTQAQLVHSEKMASLGVIAAGVAHEINNPICFVLSNTETLLKYIKSLESLIYEYRDLANKKLDKESIVQIHKKEQEEDVDYILADCPELLRETVEGVNRVKDIVSGLKTFSHIDEADEKFVDVNECVESTLKIIWNELKYKCTLHKDLGELPKTYCYPGQLIQVFTNLLVNSSQAISEKGNIYIQTLYLSNEIIIKIRDDGSGISEENLKNIFTPFFTTKPTGKGTGLGLSISFGIIKKHNGKISAKSKLNEGTEFQISLPIKDSL